ncbi:peptidoglycan/LPS O-acetylase OafA/YrhL [Sphingomonas vulcanisoli]|uniref:Peptidoglycan/LPS O-acetylase OafA/YrhL n=1 Tax=Sphingomonas vulcanisoli TaxID=1658060 RepID=A0ABX0TT39_9SPHN|nr:acyltransferase [Sphingomonas vulcanisoli]NIJ08616.1 peptidoglycan/LPS O-acetylase OafA/YrhL [Sphingomonas vulcanisoli]
MPLRQIQSHAALRGIAALLVVAYHFQFDTHKLAFETATHFFARGYLAVDLFFVLSGFIIAYANRADRRAPVTWAEANSFFRARFARLYPLLIFCLAYLLLFRIAFSLAFIVAHHPVKVDWSERSLLILASQALMLNAWIPDFGGWNIASWSISAEIVAYALFPLLVNARIRADGLTRTAMLLVSLAFYLWIAGDTGSLDIIGGWAPARCIAGFMLGMQIYYLRDRIDALPVAWLSAFQIAGAAGVIAVLLMPGCDPLIIPAVIALVGATWSDRGLLPWLLDRRPLLFLGDISYSVYLNHICMMEMIDTVWIRVVTPEDPDDPLVRLAKIAIVYGAVILVSWGTFNHVERPARQWLSRRLLGHRAAPIAASPAAP